MTIVFYQRNASGDDVRLENVFSFTFAHSRADPPMCGCLVVCFSDHRQEIYPEVAYISVSK